MIPLESALLKLKAMDSEWLSQSTDEDDYDNWESVVGCIFPSKEAACSSIKEWAFSRGVELVRGHSKDTGAEQLCKCNTCVTSLGMK